MSVVLRNAIVAWFLTCCCLAPVVSAQEWAKKMFETTSHDFGMVARGSKSVYRFKIKNLYKETVHIAGVRSSCGCTSPTVVNPTLKTFETGEIVTQYNTRSFLGQKGATITVTIDQPFPAEVQLQVEGYVRSDVVIHPGAVQLGSLDQGTTAEKRVSVSYAGRDSWQIVDVQSANPHFEVQMDETGRGGGRVSYDLVVRLKGDAPVGYLSDYLYLVTNDSQSRPIPLEVEGRIVPEISVAPAALYLGDIQPGQTVTKKLVVRGKSPFRIVDVDCDDNCFEFAADDEEKAVHLVAVTFTGGQSGKITKEIQIRTNRGENTAVSLVAYANVSEQ